MLSFAHTQTAGNALLAYGAVDFLEISHAFAAKAALGTDAAIVLFAAIIAVLVRLQFPGAVIAVAAVAGKVSVGAARAAVVDLDAHKGAAYRIQISFRLHSHPR